MKAEIHNLFKAAFQRPSQKILKMVNRGRLIVILQLYDIGISMETIQWSYAYMVVVARISAI